jgi:hypothetical protein
MFLILNHLAQEGDQCVGFFVKVHKNRLSPEQVSQYYFKAGSAPWNSYW